MPQDAYGFPQPGLLLPIILGMRAGDSSANAVVADTLYLECLYPGKMFAPMPLSYRENRLNLAIADAGLTEAPYVIGVDVYGTWNGGTGTAGAKVRIGPDVVASFTSGAAVVTGRFSAMIVPGSNWKTVVASAKIPSTLADTRTVTVLTYGLDVAQTISVTLNSAVDGSAQIDAALVTLWPRLPFSPADSVV